LAPVEDLEFTPVYVVVMVDPLLRELSALEPLAL